MSESQPLVTSTTDLENFRRLKAYQPYVIDDTQTAGSTMCVLCYHCTLSFQQPSVDKELCLLACRTISPARFFFSVIMRIHVERRKFDSGYALQSVFVKLHFSHCINDYLNVVNVVQWNAVLFHPFTTRTHSNISSSLLQ
jgi:hypothetical protein